MRRNHRRATRVPLRPRRSVTRNIRISPTRLVVLAPRTTWSQCSSRSMCDQGHRKRARIEKVGSRSARTLPYRRICSTVVNEPDILVSSDEIGRQRDSSLDCPERNIDIQPLPRPMPRRKIRWRTRSCVKSPSRRCSHVHKGVMKFPTSRFEHSAETNTSPRHRETGDS